MTGKLFHQILSQVLILQFLYICYKSVFLLKTKIGLLYLSSQIQLYRVRLVFLSSQVILNLFEVQVCQ